MGLNIIAYRILGVEDVLTWGGKTEKYLIAERFDGFDSARYSGDKEFVSKVKFTPHPDGGSDFEERYYRPTDFKEAREFVNSEEVIDCNRPRLLKLLDDMEQDSAIYLYFSF